MFESLFIEIDESLLIFLTMKLNWKNVWMGDYNINTLNEMHESTTFNQYFLNNKLSSHYYHKLINLPTREGKSSSTLC